MHTTSKPSLSAAVSSNPQDYFLLENHRDSIQLFFCWTTFVVPFRKLQKNFLSFIAIEFQMVRCAVWSRALLKNTILAQQTFCGWTDVKKRPSTPPPSALFLSYLWYSHPLMCTLGDLQSYGGGLGSVCVWRGRGHTHSAYRFLKIWPV